MRNILYPIILLVVCLLCVVTGCSDKSTPLPVVTPQSPPSPTDLTVQTILNGTQLQMKLSWRMPAGAACPLSFKIFRAVNSVSAATVSKTGRETLPQQPYTTIEVGNQLLDQYIFIDTNVDYGHTYTYAVYSQIASVPALGSKTIGTKTPEVTDLIAVNQQGNARLSWSAPAGISEGTYKIFRSSNWQVAMTRQVIFDDFVSLGFREITPIDGLTWGASNTYTDVTVLPVDRYSYVVVWYDKEQKPSIGPYLVASIIPVSNINDLNARRQ